ncbi:putative manganese transporter, partial [Micromonospora azadirachtae]
MTELLLRPLADAFMQVGVYVAVMVALFGWLRWRYGDRATDGLTRHPRFGPLVGALLGVSPGCGGAIILMPLYARKKVSFGTVIAALVATMGDSSWVVIAWNPLFALKIHLLLFAVGLVSGYVVDALGIDPARRGRSDAAEAVRIDAAAAPA